MSVDPQLRPLLDLLASLDLPSPWDLPVDFQRNQYRGLTVPPDVGGDLAEVRDVDVPGAAGSLPCRLYRPTADGVLPVVVYFHGGGWVFGDLETHDGVCRSLAARSGAAVLAVDYRLAPEHPFPAAADDALAAVRWVAEHGASVGLDGTRLAVAGDSAGGNLAAVTALAARDAAGPQIALQVLVYAVFDADFDRPSYVANAEGYLLTRDQMRWFWAQYVPDESARRDPRVSPIHTTDLSGLPPAVVLTAAYDPLCDEGVAYADALEEAGVSVARLHFDDQIHGFFGMYGTVDRAAEANDEVAALVRRALDL